MREEITGKRIVRDMRKIAREQLNASGESCVTVGVRIERGDLDGGRAKDGGVRACYYGVSGRKGFQLLRNVLQAENVVTNGDELNDLLDVFSATIVKYKSATMGEAVQQRELWKTHNCAESRLALYLLKHGIQLRNITIASYGTDFGFKAPCDHCAQWVQQNFQILPDYEEFSA